MSHKFSIKTSSLLAALGIVGAFALVSPIKHAEAGADKVDCGQVKDAEVKSFCTDVEGKAASIKKVMRDAQKALKGKGTELDCKSCHTDANGGPLNDKAAELWPKLKPHFNTAAAEYKAKKK